MAPLRKRGESDADRCGTGTYSSDPEASPLARIGAAASADPPSGYGLRPARLAPRGGPIALRRAVRIRAPRGRCQGSDPQVDLALGIAGAAVVIGPHFRP